MFKRRSIIISVVFLLALFASTISEEHQHRESQHDRDEFEQEFGDDIVDDKSNKYSEGTEDSHIEVREQSSFVQPKAVHAAKDLPTLRFLYCVSCGYRQAFDQFSQITKEKYPNIVIEGGNYPPVAWKAYAANALNLFKMALLVIIITGTNPFAAIGWGYPGVLQHAHTNKMSTCMMVFMLGNLVEQSLISTGAFEIFLGTELIWSKIEAGRVPSPQELMQLIDAQLAILGKGPASVESFGDFSTRV